MATRRPARKRATRTTRKPANSLMTDLTRVADDSKDYVAKYASHAADYMAKHPTLTVVAGAAAGAAVLAGAWTARRLWLPAVAIAAVERYLPDLAMPNMNRVVDQLKSLRPSFNR